MKEFMKKNINIIGMGLLWIILFITALLVFNLSAVDISSLSETSMYVIAIIILISITLLTICYYCKTSTMKKNKLKPFLKIFWSGILVIFTYFFVSTFQGLPLLLFTNDVNNIPLTIKIIYLLIVEFLQLGFIAFLLKDQLLAAFKDLKENHKSYFSSNLKYYLTALFIMAASNLLISFINPGNIAGNEEAVRETFLKAPIYMYISAVFLAPLLEEFVFRQGIRNMISNDKLFIITSGLVFGGLHVIGNINSFVDILYLIPYSVPGFAFAYMLTKTKNIFVPAGFHFLHNGITMSLQVIIILLGL